MFSWFKKRRKRLRITTIRKRPKKKRKTSKKQYYVITDVDPEPIGPFASRTIAESSERGFLSAYPDASTKIRIM